MSNNRAELQQPADDAWRKKEAAEQAKRDADFEVVLEAEARRNFFAGSPDAPESAYLAVREEYRKKVLLRRSEAAERADTPHRIYRW